ncbi:MAG: PTS transporter subunit EIIC [Erysipelotrichaceae bacterium]|nr:PTS transporter subunit EIIC [Erysipelotrichaceae bacterium]
MANLNAEKAAQIVEAVGGKDNISNVSHCMTRLRLVLKDESKANDAAVKNIDGIIGVARAGGQYQIIVGQSVPKVYAEVLNLGVTGAGSVDENLDGPKEAFSLKNFGKGILNYLSGTMVQLIPIMIAAAMFKTVNVLLGPDLLKIITPESDTYRLFDFLYEAGFYFMPIYIGYAAAKKLNASPMLGLFMGGILVAPSLINIVNAGQPFKVFGIAIRLVNYSQSVMPVILCVFVLSYVEKFLKKVIPDALATIFVPFLTMFIMAPLSLWILAPLGSIVGDFVGAALNGMAAHGGFLACMVIAGLWEFLVMTGMHTVILLPGIMNLLQGNPDSCVMVAGGMATWAAFGMALGAFLRLQDKKEKALAGGYFISGFVGGVTEPVLYGVGMKYKKTFICLFIGGAIGGLYAGLTHVTVYLLGATNFLSVLGYVAGGTGNLINSLIADAIAMFGTAALVYFFGFDKNEPAIQKQDK